MEISQPQGGWKFGVNPRPEGTTENRYSSIVPSGHGFTTAKPATLWLANILKSLRDEQRFVSEFLLQLHGGTPYLNQKESITKT
jgi:hypothetical protein